MKYCKSLAQAMLVYEVAAKRSFDAKTFSVDLKATTAQGNKNMHMVDRSINARSSAKKDHGAFSYVRDMIFGEADTRTDFDLRMESFVE